jgi:hypothetical protein
MIGTMTRTGRVHAVIEVSGRVDGLHGIDVAAIGLGTAAGLLDIPVASFDRVRLANARADIRCCPVCKGAGITHQG